MITTLVVGNPEAKGVDLQPDWIPVLTAQIRQHKGCRSRDQTHAAAIVPRELPRSWLRDWVGLFVCVGMQKINSPTWINTVVI